MVGPERPRGQAIHPSRSSRAKQGRGQKRTWPGSFSFLWPPRIAQGRLRSYECRYSYQPRFINLQPLYQICVSLRI